MRIDVLTIFPGYLDPLRQALLGKAIEQGRLSVHVHDLRNWAVGVHQAVDDSPYGGGPGMVMKPTVWGPALDDVAAIAGPAAQAAALSSATPHLGQKRHDEKAGLPERSSYADAADGPAGGGPTANGPAGGVVKPGDPTTGDPAAAHAHPDDRPLLIVPTPAGRPFTQDMARRWSLEDRIVFGCGRYEGIDQRVIDDAARRYRVEEVSIGDYVLIGGEVAVLVIAEAVVRLVPGVLGNRRSHEEDSFSDGLLEGPTYTKPRTWRGREVPPVLLSGDHARVDRWRRDQALLRTAARRPELLDAVDLTDRDRAALDAGRSPEE